MIALIDLFNLGYITAFNPGAGYLTITSNPWLTTSKGIVDD